MIFFECNHCQEPLEAPDSITGQTINCPSCSSTNQVPQVGGAAVSKLPTVTTEKTGKKWKVRKLAGIAITGIGLFVLFAGALNTGAAITTLGVLVWGWTIVGIWWYHE